MEDILQSKLNRSDYKILIVDDVVSNVLLLKILLTNEKFQVLTANNGKVCIDVAKREHPDLILLDVMMPELNGFDTAVIMKQDEEVKDIPIIFLTALHNTQDLVKGFKCGASDFLTKPFNKEELLMRVMHQISLVAARRLIQKQYEELKATINNRDKMYSVIAHDLRSPMASIRMTLNLLVNVLSPDVIGPEMFELIDNANKETEETHDLLDNLLKWTKSQTGALHVAFQDFELNDVLPGVIDIFKMIAESKHITLNLDLGTENLDVHADKDMFNTIIRNFMSNAIKFSHENSSIDISVSHVDNFAKISVRDHGVGISQERIETLFSAGTSTAGTRNEEGSGLGLQLCKDFAVKIGGDVTVESVQGEGSTFSVLIPIVKK
ncbi:MAG: hybrid sensor histidine kinase/response regulator [Prevotella sp.]|nr:hybrid sensor histidine kinase/response regulator [Prevotella sp.]MBO5205077.1 hybrid sensor histidine kinase/response regulator [Prevotella sp.]